MSYSIPISYTKVVVHQRVRYITIFKSRVSYVFEFRTVMMLKLLIVFAFNQS